MKSISIKYLMLAVIGMTIVSCGDFLNQTPETLRAVDNAYKTAADFNNAVVGAYATFKTQGMYSNGGQTNSLLMMSDGVSDCWDIGQTRNSITTFIFEIEEFKVSISNTLVSNAWRDHYIGIGRANTILDKIENATISLESKKRYEAEAKFLRAMFYFNLTRLFGDVPLVDHSVSDPYAANNLTRNPASEIYDLIISDLQFAEASLPETISGTEAGRASKWAAKALLGKVYLTLKNYSQASVSLNEIIASGKFNVVENSYPEVFSSATSFEANKDVILAVQYKTGQVGQGSSLWSSSIPFGAAGSLPEFGSSASGEGYFRPTQDLIDSYEDGDLRKDASVAISYLNGDVVVNEKYCVKYKQLGPVFGDSDVDFPILRYADVLLMQAEALNEQGQTNEALILINPIRTRAGLADLSGLTVDELRSAIEHERYVELAFEGHRWFDLVRTDRYLDVMTSKGYETKDFNNIYPVPQRETDLNGGLGQNQGY